MPNPKISFFTPEIVKKIIVEAIDVLMNPGVKVQNLAALSLLADFGAQVDHDLQIARIPKTIIHKALDTAPSEFYLYDLIGNPVVHYGGDSVSFNPGSSAITILDSQTHKHRPPTTNDFIKFVKLVETISQLDAQSTAFVCSDVVEEIGDWYRLYLALNYMRKPIITGAFRKDTWWTMKEMLVTVAGGEAELAAKPIAVFDVCPSPPLMWSDLTCQNLIDCAKAGIPVQLVSMPLAGATAPVTIAASVVQHTAESLSGVVIHQLANPGAPIIWGGSPAAFDMRSGTTPMGAAGTWLIDAGYVQVGKSLNLPTHVYMGMSDAKIVDAQCGLESMGGTLMASFIGADMVSGAGMLDFESCQSFEKLVIDAEIIGLAKRIISGIEIREEPIGLDLIREMGHSPGYLSHPHTRRWYREELYIPSSVIDRGSLEAWEVEGSRTTYERASDRVDELLKSYDSPVLSDDLRKELRSIASREAKRYGMQSLPSLHDEII